MSDINFNEIVSSKCVQCMYNVTKLKMLNPICVHCTRVEFVRRDMFRKKEAIVQTETED